MIELKPCPFCGCHEVDVICYGERFIAECCACLCAGPLKDTDSEATAAWNSRVRDVAEGHLSQGLRGEISKRLEVCTDEKLLRIILRMLC